MVYDSNGDLDGVTIVLIKICIELFIIFTLGDAELEAYVSLHRFPVCNFIEEVFDFFVCFKEFHFLLF